jgi:tetratricopeptide (TPR) repeat protein
MSTPVETLFRRYQNAHNRFLHEPTAANINECVSILETVVALPSHPVGADIELALRLADRTRVPGASPDVTADAHTADALLEAAATTTTVSLGVCRDIAIAHRVAYLATGQRAEADRGLMLLRLAVTGGSSPDPEACQQLMELSEEVWNKAGDPTALDNLIEVYQWIVASLTGLTVDQQAGLLDQRAFRLMDRYRLSHRPQDAAEALANRRRAVALASPESSDRAHLAYGLALCLEGEAERTGQPGLLDESRAMLSQEIERIGSADRAALISRRGVAARMTYRFTGDVANLDAAVDDQKAVLEAGPVSDDARSLYHVRLSNALADRYRSTGEEADLDESVNQAEAAIASLNGRPGEDPGMAHNTLGQALSLRYELRWRHEDLTASLAAYRSAIAADRVGQSESLWLYLNNLADKLVRHEYQRTGHIEILDEAAGLLTEAESCDPPPGELAMVLNTHGLALLTRYSAASDPSDLNEAVRLTAKAVELTPQGATGLPMRLANWASALLARADREGDVPAVEQAVAARRLACTLVAPWSHDGGNFQVNLAAALVEQYQNTGRRDCLDEAEEICARISLAGPANWQVSILANSAVVLMTIADASRSAEPLAEATRRLTTALTLAAPGDPAQAIVAYNLAAVLQSEGRITRRSDLVAKAITAAEQLLGRLPGNHPVRPDAELVLAIGYWIRGVVTGTPGDCAAAVALGEKSLAQEAPGTLRWFNTALRLSSFYQPAGHPPGRSDELLERVLADSPVPMQAIEAARQLGASRSRRGDPDGAATAYTAGVRAMESLFDRQLARTHQEGALRKGVGLATLAAVTLASAGRLKEAVDVLESGRTVLSGTALHSTRRRLEALAAAGYEDLAEEYRAAAAALGDRYRRTGRGSSAPSAEAIRAAPDRIQAAIERISAIPGFESFPRPRPPDTTDLARLPAPCVYLVPGPAGGVALMIGAGGTVESRPLPGLDDGGVGTRVESWRRLITAAGARTGNEWSAEITSLGEWLWTAGMATVSEMAQGAKEVIMIPCGKLVDLPLHAACRRGAGGARYLVEDLTIRYSPSVRTVLDTTAAQNRPATSLLVLADETLRHAPAEAAAVAAIFDTAAPVLLRSQSAHAQILAALAKAHVAHFACHAFSNPVDPLASAVNACRDTPITLGDILQLDLPAVRLVVLSACESAVSGESLPDEVINLASGLVQAGVAGVVGSLWRVDDASTRVLMERFYELWRAQPMAPAAALCRAQAWMRSGGAGELPGASHDPALPAAWAPFIFVGA